MFEFDMVHLVANSSHHKESKPEKRKQSAAPFAQLRGKKCRPNQPIITLLLSMIRNNFETNTAKPLKVIKSYKKLKKVIKSYRNLPKTYK